MILSSFFKTFPYQYHLRNLFVRPASTALNILAILVTVLVFLVMNGMAVGLRESLESTGRENVLILLTKGSQTAEVSKIPPNFFPILRYFPQIAKRSDGTPLLSQEVYTVKPLVPKEGGGGRRWIPIRGVDPESFELYQELFSIQGKGLKSPQEAIVGNLVKTKMKNLQSGDWLPLGRQTYKIVGFFNAKGSAFESEIWVSRNDLKVSYDLNYDSMGVVRFHQLKDRDRFIEQVKEDKRLRLDLKTEREYFASLSENANVLQFIAVIIAFVLSIASIFTGMNALYSSVAARAQEIGTLRSMGFGKTTLLVGFLFEGVLIACIAGFIATLLSFSFEHIPIAFMRSSFRIRIPLGLQLQGLLMAFLVGLIGSFLPARQVARMRIVDALK